MTILDTQEKDPMLELDKSWTPEFEQWLDYCMDNLRYTGKRSHAGTGQKLDPGI